MNFHLRPRFLPDREARKEWGRLGAVQVRMIKRGFRVPPTAAMGGSEIQTWLESFSGYPDAIEKWRAWENPEEALALLRSEILNASMPEHWPKSYETLRRLLCGEQDWPFYLRPTFVKGHEPSKLHALVVREYSPEALWKSFREIIASVFEIETARDILLEGIDPKTLRVAVVIQPELIADAGHEVPEKFKKEFSEREHLASRILGKPAQLKSLFDGEEMWYLDIKPTNQQKTTAGRKIKHLLIDLDGTLLGARQFPLQIAFISNFVSEVKEYGGWRRAFRALRSVNRELKTPSDKMNNLERVSLRFSEVMGKSIVDAGGLLKASVYKLFPKLEKHFYPIPGAKDFLDWAKTRFPMTLATNPVWDEEIIGMRLKWAGIDPKIFQSMTHSERMRACKPAKEYYLDLLAQEKLDPNDTLLVGDDWLNDLSATEVGIPVFLLSKRFDLRPVDSSARKAPAWQGSYPMLKTLLRVMAEK